MWKIGINAQLLSGKAGYRQAGIHHYIKQVLNHLPPNPQFEYTVYTGDGAEQHLHNSLTVKSTKWPTENPFGRILWEQTAWPVANRRHRIDLLHSMAFVTPVATSVPKIVTVFDLSFMKYPERFTRFKRHYLQTQTKRSCKTAQRIIVISQSGREDVHQLFDIPYDRIDVVYPGVDPQFKPLSPDLLAAFKTKHKLNNPFLLHVGTLEPRKNIPVLLDALATQPSELHLVLVGGKGWLYDEIFARIKRLGLQNRVHFAGFVPDEELVLWYNCAAGLVFPSIYEGFGMPIVEAMACGTPVIASSASSMPEAVGNAGLLFDPSNVQALSECIGNVLHNTEQVATMREQGFQHARNFSWIQSGEKMMTSYHHVLQQAA